MTQPILTALSVRNPWASLIVLGAKGVENRTWNTNFRGRVAIHVGTRPSDIDNFDAFLDELPTLDDDVERERFRQWLDEEFDPRDPDNMLRSAIIGTVEIVDVVDVESQGFDAIPDDLPGMKSTPWAWADTGSRYKWLLANPVPFETPIRSAGRLNLWSMSPAVAKAVNAEHERCRVLDWAGVEG